MRRFASAKACRLYRSVSPGERVSRLHKRVGVDATPGAKESTHGDHFGNDPRRERDDDERRICERSRWRQRRFAARAVGEFVGSERQVSPSLLVASSPPRLPLIACRQSNDEDVRCVRRRTSFSFWPHTSLLHARFSITHAFSSFVRTRANLAPYWQGTKARGL